MLYDYPLVFRNTCAVPLYCYWYHDKEDTGQTLQIFKPTQQR